MIVKHCGTSYECEKAVKCENDKYIKLYDANGIEIVEFRNISDFSEFTVSNGSFIQPCDCRMPIPLNAYVIGGFTISPNEWIVTDSGKYRYEIKHDLISGNDVTCNILLNFAKDTDFTYEATQEDKMITILIDSAPKTDVVIESIVIIKA